MSAGAASSEVEGTLEEATGGRANFGGPELEERRAAGAGGWRSAVFWMALLLLPLLTLGFYAFLQAVMSPVAVEGVEAGPVDWSWSDSPVPRVAELEARIAAGDWHSELPGGEPGFGIDRAAWARMTVTNRSNPESFFAFESSQPYLGAVRLLERVEDGRFRMEQSGQAVAWHQRERPSIRPSVRFEVPEGESRTLYFHISDAYTVSDPFYLRTARVQDMIEFWEVAQYLGYFGVLGGLVVFHLFWYAIIRLRVYRYYLIYLISTGGLVFVGGNFNLLFFPWATETARSIAIAVGVALMTWSLALFTRRFLDLRANLRWGDFVLKWLGLAALAFAGATAVLHGKVYLQWQLFGLLIQVSAAALVLGMGVAVWQAVRGSVAARRFLLALLPLIIGYGWTIITQFSWGPIDHTNGFLMLSGSALECIFLGLVVAFDYRDLQNRHAALEQSYRSDLQREVQRQTAELKQTSGELEDALRDRERLLQIIGHDLRTPVSSAIAVGDYLSGGLGEVDPEEVAMFGRELRRQGKVQLELLENLLAWGARHHGQERGQAAARFRLWEVFDRIMRLHEPAARAKGIELRNAITPGLHLVTDERAVETILRNFLSNAVKFTPRGGCIDGRLHGHGDRIFIEVVDDGTGMTREQLERLRTAAHLVPAQGTDKEFGSGLGLTFCRELAAGIGGQLEFESERGKGTCARLVLPAACVIRGDAEEAAGQELLTRESTF